jgi:hypothetical protein
MKGVGNLIVGFILIFIFLATLTIQTIPFIWTGALLMGIVSIASGIYQMAKSATSSPQQNIYYPPPPPPVEIPNQVQSAIPCPKCGHPTFPGETFCGNCGTSIGH